MVGRNLRARLAARRPEETVRGCLIAGIEHEHLDLAAGLAPDEAVAAVLRCVARVESANLGHGYLGLDIFRYPGPVFLELVVVHILAKHDVVVPKHDEHI